MTSWKMLSQASHDDYHCLAAGHAAAGGVDLEGENNESRRKNSNIQRKHAAHLF